MNLTIRAFRSEDPAWVIARHGAIYAREVGFDGGFEQGIADKMAALLARDDPFKRLWIAEANGQRAGSIAVSTLSAGTAFLNFVLADPAFRNRGIARRLMHRAIRHARTQGFARVRLETYDCLEPARVLYRGQGFEIVEATPGVEKFGRVVDQEFWELPL